jgi:hypothetical protein
MWGAGSSAGLFIGAFILGLVLMAFVFGVGILAVPIAILGVALIGFVEWRRRRTQADSIHRHRRQAEEDKIEFTDRDQETLVSE